jgi:uncharacterized protein with FMN-binding domain
MKKVLIAVLAVVVVIVIAVISMFVTAGKNAAKYTNFNFSQLNLSNVADGTYTGSEDGGMVKATVEVTVKDHLITQVKILAYDNGKGKPAEAIVDDIVKSNSLEVDTVSGATLSSNVIKMAVYNALKQ